MTRNNMLRGWWKPWRWSTRSWAITIVLSVLAFPFVTRWICLWQIPDVDLELFDVDDVVELQVPDEQNAYKVYAHVMELLSSPAKATAEMPSAEVATANQEVSLADRLMAHNEPALAEYIRAGKMERMVGPPSKTMTIWTDLDLYQRLRQVVRTHNALGITFAECGQFEKAWECHRANLQCSIHIEQTPQAICGLIAYSIRSMSAEGLVHWASNPAITAQRLRAARIEIAHEYQRRVSYLFIAKGEYQCMRNSFKELAIVDEVLPTTKNGTPSPMPFQIGKRILLWCFAQPELGRRLNRQIVLNNAMEQSKPLSQRRHSVQRAGTVIYDLDPKVPMVPGQLSPEQLIRTLDSQSPVLLLNKTMLPAMIHVDTAGRRDSARFAALMVLFAAQEYRRTHDEFPKTLEQLIPAFLNEIPIDPMEETGKPMNYRREADGTAIVWSVGLNGIDDQGDFSSPNYLDTGYQIKLNRPDPVESTKL